MPSPFFKINKSASKNLKGMVLQKHDPTVMVSQDKVRHVSKKHCDMASGVNMNSNQMH